VELTTERLQQSDVVVIVTDHTNVDYQAVADHAPLIMDARNAMSRTRQSKARVVPLSAP
jgi:UDP-N-acetyl-D-glucosamine dehydrogenase